jgi:hypothetical protein
MPGTMIDLLQLANERRSIGQDLLHFAWIGDIPDDLAHRAFDGVRSTLRLTNVPWARIVFWCESRNKSRARSLLDGVSPQISVMSMYDLFKYWSNNERDTEPGVYRGARDVYASLKRLEAFSAAKDLASLCILHIVGGYFFDASVRFARLDECGDLFTGKPPEGWTVENTMPVLASPHWGEDAWALYANAGTLVTLRALDSYLLGASVAGLNHARGHDFYVKVTDIRDQRRSYGKYRELFQHFNAPDPDYRIRRLRVDLIIELIYVALQQGFGEAITFKQSCSTDTPPVCLLPELGLVKIVGSSTTEFDPSKYVGWKAVPFRDWSTKRV